MTKATKWDLRQSPSSSYSVLLRFFTRLESGRFFLRIMPLVSRRCVAAAFVVLSHSPCFARQLDG